MGPQVPKNVARDTSRDLSGLVGELAALLAVAHHWLTDSEYAALTHRLEAAHAAAEAALVVQRSTYQRSLIGCLDCEIREEALARRVTTVFRWAHASWDNSGISFGAPLVRDAKCQG
jgi:hypothetical protein